MLFGCEERSVESEILRIISQLPVRCWELSFRNERQLRCSWGAPRTGSLPGVFLCSSCTVRSRLLACLYPQRNVLGKGYRELFLSCNQQVRVSEVDWKWKGWRFQARGLVLWNEWPLEWHEGRWIVRAQPCLRWLFCGCPRYLECVSMRASALNVYGGCRGMFKTPATGILKWVIWPALLR